jgi:broad specificity phosphatase PhoE
MLNEPAALWLLRHGQSQGNVIRDLARGRGVDVLDIADRDMDVPLSELGQRQADAFGTWLSTEPDEIDLMWSWHRRTCVPSPPPPVSWLPPDLI